MGGKKLDSLIRDASHARRGILSRKAPACSCTPIPFVFALSFGFRDWCRGSTLLGGRNKCSVTGLAAAQTPLSISIEMLPVTPQLRRDQPLVSLPSVDLQHGAAVSFPRPGCHPTARDLGRGGRDSGRGWEPEGSLARWSWLLAAQPGDLHSLPRLRDLHRGWPHLPQTQSSQFGEEEGRSSEKVDAFEKLGGWRQPLELCVSGVPTAETGGLQEEAEQGRGTEQRSDGMTWRCGSTAALIPGINMYDPLVSLVCSR